MMNNIPSQCSKMLAEIRTQNPLVHHITNYVTVNDCANVTLAIGASPIMADDILEAADITAQASSLVLNMGTLNQRTIESMLASGRRANSVQLPVIFDPVGAGASEFRNRTAAQILQEVKVNVLRGNISEIRFISGMTANTRGVDASADDIRNTIDEAKDIAVRIAQKLGCIVVITGESDVISNGSRTVIAKNGHVMLSRVTGTGCMSTSLIGAFCGIVDKADQDYLIASVAGIVCMGIAGEVAHEQTKRAGSGSFRASVIDAINKLDSKTIMSMAKTHEQ